MELEVLEPESQEHLLIAWYDNVNTLNNLREMMAGHCSTETMLAKVA